MDSAGHYGRRFRSAYCLHHEDTYPMVEVVNTSDTPVLRDYNGAVSQKSAFSYSPPWELAKHRNANQSAFSPLLYCLRDGHRNEGPLIILSECTLKAFGNPLRVELPY